MSTTNQNQVEGLDEDQVGLMCGCTGPHIRRMAARGLFPRPAKLGALNRWSRQVVLDWLASQTTLPTGNTVMRGGQLAEKRG